MKYSHFDSIKMDASRFGLGCMRFNGPATEGNQADTKKAIKLIRQAIDGGVNYLDTAFVYLDKTSEKIVGKALLDGYRDKVTIATKMPIEFVHDRASMEALLNDELAKLQTDHVDYYLMHGINKEKWLRFKEIGADKFFTDMKAQGKIRYKCFSFHGEYDEFEYILKDYDWDMVQIQFNFMDEENQAGLKGLKLAGEMGIPVVIMEPLLGGKLAKAPSDVQKVYDSYPIKRSPSEWAFRYLADYPQIMTILSGCNEEAQIEENLKIFGDVQIGCMSDEEKELIKKVRDAYKARTKIGCTGCSYCMPCPGGVDIPKTFAVWNECSLYEITAKQSWAYHELTEAGMTPDKCLQCGACEAACPQSLNIIESLQTAWGELN